MAEEYAVATTAMLRSVSPTGLVRVRDAFGQVIAPKRGSVVASPAPGFYDPNPDYFFHWLRDSALVIDALLLLIAEGSVSRDALSHVDDFVAFSLALGALDGAELAQRRDYRDKVAPQFQKYLRTEEELAAVSGESILAETRFNPDGTLDVIRWSRPQHDGPALRALTVMRREAMAPAPAAGCRRAMADLLRADLDFTCRHWQDPCFDLWEEVFGHHYYTRRVQAAALAAGAAWAAALGDRHRSARYRTAADALGEALAGHWKADAGCYAAHLGRTEADGGPGADPDIAVVLAVLHAKADADAHSISDPGVQATLARLEAIFAGDYPINRTADGALAPAMGRYRGDIYGSGGAYYFATLAAAEFYYRLAAAVRGGRPIRATRDNAVFLERMPGFPRLAPERELGSTTDERRAMVAALLAKGDRFMATVRRYTPASGELSEQFDQCTGEQTSAKDLAWSYAAFITACAARSRLLRLMATA
ncbi:glycoside hydrolase family 15 protein [Chelatococcus albus]|nr:glycoside hydrolase family 15 protein [Chelatococcus sp. SYSU_G07232]